MTYYYLMSIIILMSGGITLDFIHKNYPKSMIKNIVFWVMLTLTIMSSLAVIYEKFNIVLIIFGIFKCIYTYKYRKKENISTFYPYFANGYFIGYALILWGIAKGFTNGFFW